MNKKRTVELKVGGFSMNSQILMDTPGFKKKIRIEGISEGQWIKIDALFTWREIEAMKITIGSKIKITIETE